MKFLEKNKTIFLFAMLMIFSATFVLFHDLFFGKILATNDAGTNDLLFYYFPARKLFAESLRAGEFLQWTPYVFSGFPLFAEGGSLSALYPLNLLIWYSFPPVAALNFYIIIHSLLMGLGMYLFVSKITGNKILSIPSAAVSAVCGSIIVGHTRHLDALAIISLTPLLFYFAELYLEKFKFSYIIPIGLLFGVFLLISHPESYFISGALIILYIFLRVYFINKKKTTDNINLPKKKLFLKTLINILIAVIIAFIIGFPQIKATLEIIPDSFRGQTNATEQAGLGSMSWNGILTFIYPYYSGDAGNSTFQDKELYHFWEWFFYCGAITFLLAVYGSIKNWKNNSAVRALAVIALLSYLFALGDNFFLHKIFSIFPIIKSFRFPSRWMLGTEIAVLTLSAFGVKSIAQYISGRIDNVKSSKSDKKTSSNKSKRNIFSNLSLANQYKLAFVLSAAMILEIYTVAGRQVATTEPETFFNSSSFVNSLPKNEAYPRMFNLDSKGPITKAYLDSRGWEGNLENYGLMFKYLPQNFNMYKGISSVDGYYNLTPNYNYNIFGGELSVQGIINNTATLRNNKFLPGPGFIKLCSMWGIKYYMSPWEMPPPYQKVWDSVGLKAYTYKDIFPRAWMVSKIISVPEGDSKLPAFKIIDSTFNPLSEAVIQGGAPLLPEGSSQGGADIISSDNHNLTIKTNSMGMLVVSDTWNARWKAYIDGNEVKVLRVNSSMRGIIISKAGTIVEMKYDKINIALFGTVSYCVILFGIIFFLYSQKTKNKNNESIPNINS